MVTRKIAVLGDVNFAHANAMLGGVSRYAAQQADWEVVPLHFSQESALGRLVEEGRLDGIIGTMVSDRWVASLRAAAPIPLVNVSSHSALASVPSVIPDDAAIGALAAEHFVRRHHAALLYAGVRSYTCSEARYEGFRIEAERQAREAMALPHATLTSHLKEWHDVLRDQPRPIGVFCVDDHTARRTIALCRRMELRIPDDIAIIGVGNSQLDSFFAGIGISSIEIPHGQIGYEAASLLDRQLCGEAVPSDCLRVAPRGLQLHETTGVGALNSLVGRAINYIEAHLASPITVQDLVTDAHASRRLLEVRFRESIGRSPYQEITRLRMAHADRLLRDPALPIAEVAARCGYPELSHFYARFKQHHADMPPGTWRRKEARRVGRP
ncbi:MAG: substrate-binding domain-containing protein [Verrucomicrobia bacterium]|jgi:LacI family transcriptional regulator|nr:substrate-binding domain-containing protein [Verrucomicrobiota bacterium]